MTRVLLIFGTRPEAIKLAPVIKRMTALPDLFDVKICVTAQHRVMLDSVLAFFEIQVDYDLDLMRPNQNLNLLSGRMLEGLHQVLASYQPQLIVVHGDTTTSLIGALAAHHARIELVHVEAGLRSFDRYAPCPEETNRILISRIADYHFAPTAAAQQNLFNEGIVNRVWLTGNTAIDAIHLGLEKLSGVDDDVSPIIRMHDGDGKLIFVTCYRRENFGESLVRICRAIRQIAFRFPCARILFPVHLNPAVQRSVHRELANIANVSLIGLLNYGNLIIALKASHIVLTDSGGLQEEAPAFNKPVLVLREVTERTEGIECGTARLVGTNVESIVASVSELLVNDVVYQKMAQAPNPYGDGHAAERIVASLREPHVQESFKK